MESCKARGLSRTTAPRKASMTPLEAATAFASEVGGAKVEDLSDDGMRGTLALAALGGEDVGSQAEEWQRSARPIFISKRCLFQSDHADEELERFVSLPPRLQARVVAICEHHRGCAVLEAERFELTLGHRQENGDALYALACELVEIARPFPPAWDRKAPVRSRVHACAHCNAVVFLPEDGVSCVRCGAPACLPAAATSSALASSAAPSAAGPASSSRAAAGG